MTKLSSSTKLKLIWPLLYLLMTVVFFAVTWPAYPQFSHFIGATITIVAFIFWIVARMQLGNAFTITPNAKFIVKSGLYSKLRHPVYYFSIMAVAGLSIYVWWWPMFVILVLFVLLQLVRINKEEVLLSNSFGDEYLHYKRTTWF